MHINVNSLTAPKKSPKKRKIPFLKPLTFLFMVLIILLWGLNTILSWGPLKYYKCYISAPDYKIEIKEPSLFKIEKGETLEGIVQLARTNLKLSEPQTTDLMCLIRKNNDYKDFKAGIFYFKEGEYTLNQIINRLKNPNPPTIKVTIPEGLRYDEIASTIATKVKGILPNFDKTLYIQYAADPKSLPFYKTYPFLQDVKTLEGFLYPATYSFEYLDTTENIIQKQLNAYNKYIYTIIQEARLKNNEITKKLNDYEILILASIIERETTNDFTERRMVADILLRRLFAKRPLEVDATLLYPKKNWSAPITPKDKQSSSLYNTYRYQGLPPTPISNPGQSAVKAVLNPLPNQYWYYLHGKDGKIRYAKTYLQHLNNIKLYLR